MTLLSGIGLIVLIIVFVAIITTLVEKEQGTIATIVIIGCIVLAHFTGYDPVFQAIWEYVSVNIWQTALMVVGYLVTGVLYSFWRWYLFLKERKKSYKSYKTGPLKAEDAPKASEYSLDLVRWVSYWPFCMWWTLLNEPIKWIVDTLGGVYDSISKKVFEAA